MSTPDLILELRLASLQKNLEQIQGIETSIRSRRADIVKLHGSVFGPTPVDPAGAPTDEVLAPLRGAIKSLQRAMHQAILPCQWLQEGKELTDDARQSLTLGIDSATRATQDVAKQVEALKDVVGRLYRRWTEIHEDRLKETFRASNAMLTSLQEMTGSLEQEVQDAVGNGGQQAAPVAWADYQGLLTNQLEDLFAGYVEVLGGLALRNIGFDQGVCSMADRLVDESIAISSRKIWESTAIPSAREARRRTLSRIIRIGFPEWTIWAVPLASHDFARVVLADSSDDVKKLLGAVGRGGDADVLTADAFSTAIIGPAYPCALLMLELDPAGALDRERAETVLAMLRRMDVTEDLAAVREQQRTAWNDAVEQAAGANGSAAEPDQEDEEAEPLPELAARTHAVMAFLQGEGEGLIYEPDRWQRITGWRLEADTQVPIGHLDDTRDILNAAWWERLRPRTDGEPGADDDEIARRAKDLWDTTMDRADDRVGGGRQIRTGTGG